MKWKTGIYIIYISLCLLIGTLCLFTGLSLLKQDEPSASPPSLPWSSAKEGALHRTSVLTESMETSYTYDEDDMALLQTYREYNSDVVGLITIEDTVLNHPIVQTPEDEDYYLYKDLDQKYNSHGVPFLSAASQIEGRKGIRVLYGHNIHKNTRDVFADLAGYRDLDYYQTHPIIKTVTESGTRNWLIFAYFIVDNADEAPFRYSDVTEFLSKTEFQTYFTEVQKRNWLNVPIEFTIEDTFLLLSSCSNELSGSGTNRMVVIAKELSVQESYEEAVTSSTMKEDPLLPERLR